MSVHLSEGEIGFPSYSQMERLTEAVEEIAGIRDTSSMSALEHMIGIQFIAGRTGKVWKRKIWKVGTNTTSDCPAMDEYEEGFATPFTDNVAGNDPYMDNYEVFRWEHVNYTRDADDGTARVVTLEGYPDYKTEGAVDVGTMLPTFWWKFEEHDTYYELYFSDSPHDELGLIPWKDAVKTNGLVLPYFIVSSYYSGQASDTKWRSQPGLVPITTSYNTMVTKYQEKGDGYWGAGSDLALLAWIYLVVKYGTKNSQKVFKGCSSYNLTANVALAETDVKHVKVTAIGSWEVGEQVCIGPGELGTPGSKADRVTITSIEQVTVDSTTYFQLNLDLDSPISVTTEDKVYTNPYRAGSTDKVMGHYDGSVTSNTSGHFPFRISGIELMNGQAFIASDTVIEFLNNHWKVFKAKKGVAHVANAHTGYSLVGECPAFTSDGWVANILPDMDTAGYTHEERGSSDALGTGDYHYNGGTEVADGTLRQWSSLGHLNHGSRAGLCYVDGAAGLSSSYWYYGSHD